MDSRSKWAEMTEAQPTSADVLTPWREFGTQDRGGSEAAMAEGLDESWWRGGEMESPFAASPAHGGEPAMRSPEAELPGPETTLRRPDGIDVYSGNALPAWAAVKKAGISFIIHKCSERLRNGSLISDKPSFGLRWEQSRINGLIRGSYHYYRHRDGESGSVQADMVVQQVPRLGPGDLAPSLDFENAAIVTGNAEPTPAAWRVELESFLDTLEVKLGRTPLVYTSGSAWGSHIQAAAAGPDFAHFGNYPLWQKSYAGPRFVGTVDLDNAPNHLPPAFTEAAANRAESQYKIRQSSRPSPARLAPWQDWTFFQYSPFTPKALLNNPFELLIDFDTYNGTIYGLRGMADLGRVGVASTALGAVVAHGEVDRHIHVLHEGASRSWTDVDLMDGALPGLGADPVLLGTGGGVILYFRSEDRMVEAVQPDLASSWDVTDLSSIAGVTGWHDPRAILVGDQRFVVFSGHDDDWHLLTRNQAVGWTVSHLLSEARRSGMAPVPASSGQPALYMSAGSPAPRVVGRAGPRGELFELALGARGWEATNLHGTVTGPQGVPPAATYSPCIYQTAAEAFIVYRAVRGQLWQIARGARRAINISAAGAGSPLAVGHPTCFVLGNEAHVVYRGADRGIHELSLRGGTWSARRLPCDAPAASDPTATADGSTALVAYRGVDGMVRVLRFEGATWTCADTIRSLPAAGGSRPEEPPGARPGLAQATHTTPATSSIFAALGPAAVRFRELVTAGDERSAVSLAYQHNQRNVNAITDLVFFTRHHDLGERRLRPEETALAQEWRTIREHVVGPAIAALTRDEQAAAAAAAERPDEARSEATYSAAEPKSAGGHWLHAIAELDAESGTAGGLHAEGIGSIVDDARKTVAGVIHASADVFAQETALAFDDFLHRLDELERQATADGYGLTQRVTAFRKVFYDSAASRGSYPGVSTGGGVWNILIPGAAATPLPPSWQSPSAAGQVEALRHQKDQIINRLHVDIGHVLTGLDARNHPTDINLSVLGFPLIRMRSNLEATTFTGDLGSVVVKYLYGSNRSFRDTAMELEPTLLNNMYNASAEADMSGNADAHLVPLEPSHTLEENLRAYYAAATGGWRRRWHGFMVTIGLGTFTPVPAAMGAYLQSRIIGTFSGKTERWRADMQGEIMNAALAYAAATGRRADLVNVQTEPRPGIFVPTYSDMYWNASGWVLDEFLRRLKIAVGTELGEKAIP